MSCEIYLKHHGVKGMKWGVRNDKKTSSGFGRRKKQKVAKQKPTNQRPKRKKIKHMTEDELNLRIKRLELEKKYRELDLGERAKSRAATLVRDVATETVKRSLTNIGTQALTHALGVAINKACKVSSTDVDKRIVNPQKGQKDS